MHSQGQELAIWKSRPSYPQLFCLCNQEDHKCRYFIWIFQFSQAWSTILLLSSYILALGLLYSWVKKLYVTQCKKNRVYVHTFKFRNFVPKHVLLFINETLTPDTANNLDNVICRICVTYMCRR